MTSQVNNTIDLLLAESFKEIAAVKPIEKITIKEITDRAGVIRPTFYNHFQDKYELMEWIIRAELMNPMKTLLKEYRFKEALLLPFEALLANKQYYTQAAKLEGQNSFAESLQKQICELLLECIPEDKVRQKLPYAWLTPKRTMSFFASVIADAVLSWIASGMDAPKEEFVDVFINLCNHSVADLVHRLDLTP